VQGEFVTRHTTGTHQSVRATCTSQIPPRPQWVPCYNASKTPGNHRLLFQKKLPGSAKIQCTRLRPAFPPHAEARHFRIFTNHKPITYTFQQKRDKFLPRQFNQLEFKAQFTTDIRHISRQDNVVADALSCVESITAPPSYDALVASQDSDDEHQTIRQSNTALRLEKLPISGTMVTIYCGTFAGRPWPYIPGPLWLQGFQSVHDLSYPGTKSNGETGRTACVAGRAERLPHLDKGLPVLPALQNLTPQSLHWATLHRLRPDFCTSTKNSWGPFRRQRATHTASLQSTVSRAGQKSSPSRTSWPSPWHAPY
jgi:hypothetical protein